MTKQLKVLSEDLSGDPFETLAFYGVAVFRLNGHVPDREEIAKTLKIKGLEGSAEEVQKVVDLLPEEIKSGL